MSDNATLPNGWQLVVGLEVHVELATKTKMFSASANRFGDEPNTKELNQALLKSGKDLYLPRVNGIDLEWVLWSGSNDQLAPSKLSKQLLEPTGAALTDLSLINLIVVPALRIDRSGYRLGQGGGFYDRALPKLSAWSIGLIYPDEISSVDLPREEFDVPLNAAATPDLILRFS